MSLKISSSTGAAAPIIAYDGVSTTPSTPTPISVKLSTIAGLRPARSPNAPITIAPTGRATNPTANVSSDNIRFSNGVWFGKNVRPICTANSAYVVKS